MEDWLRNKAAPDLPAVRRLRPSDPGENDGKIFRTGESMALRARALQRGVLVHRLLQSLPDLASERRRDLAIDYLARNAEAWTEAERAALAERVLALLSEPRFAAVFAPGSRAEVPIVGRLQNGRPVSGRVDRLVVTADEVLIADYKTTNRPGPRHPDEVSKYVKQLAPYRAVLGQLYPDKTIRAALLWTDVPDLMEIPAAALDRALAGLTSP